MKKALIFYGILFVISSIYFSFFSLISLPLMTLYLFIAMWIPGILAIVFVKVHKESYKSMLKLNLVVNKYVVFSVFVPFILVGFVTLLNFMFYRQSFGMPPSITSALNDLGVPESLHLLLMVVQITVNGVIFGATINAIFGLGEELAWRGYLYKKLENLPLWKSGLFIGFLWGFWHTPLVIQGYNFPDNPALGILFMTVSCGPLGIIMHYLVKKSGTVLSAAIFHGVFNAIAGTTILFMQAYTDFLHNPFGVFAIIVYTLGAVIVIYKDYKSKDKDVIEVTE